MESQLRSSNQVFGKRQKRSLNDLSSKFPSSNLSSIKSNEALSRTYANGYFLQQTSSPGANAKNILINKVSHPKQLDTENKSTTKLHQHVENTDIILSKTNSQIMNSNVGVNIIADDNGNSSTALNNFNETEMLKTKRPGSSTDIETSHENNNKVIYCSIVFVVEHQLLKLSKTGY